MDKVPELPHLLGDALTWYLQVALRMLDRLGAHAAAGYVSSAIDAIELESAEIAALSDEEIERDEHTKMVLEMFRKNKVAPGEDGPSS